MQILRGRDILNRRPGFVSWAVNSLVWLATGLPYLVKFTRIGIVHPIATA